MKPETALHKLRNLYRDAHSCPKEFISDDNVLKWAGDSIGLEDWATYKIRHGGWGYTVCAATIREASRLFLIARNAPRQAPTDQELFDPLLPADPLPEAETQEQAQEEGDS
jgi:hypothetical protein